MKKRIISLILVVMILAGVSVISTSAVTSYNLWVGGVTVTSLNAKDVLGDGKVKFDANTNTLYLNNAQIKGVVLAQDYLSAGIYAANMDLTVAFTGNNRITDVGGCEWSMGIGVDGGDLTLQQNKSGASLSVYSAYADGYSVGLYACVNFDDLTTGGDLFAKSGAVTVGYNGDKLTTGHGMGVCAFNVDIRNDSEFNVTGAPSSEGYSYGINGCGKVEVSSSGTVLRAKGSEAVESHGIYVISMWEEDENGNTVNIGDGDLSVDTGAKVIAEGGKAELFSAGVNTQGNVTCSDNASSLTATGGDTKYTESEYYTEVYPCSYGITSYGNVKFAGGIVNATAGYGYDSCAINALSEYEYDEVNDIYIPLKGDVTISGAKVSAVSKGGYAYSEGVYIGGNLVVSSGSLTASGGVADAQDKDIQTESNAVYSANGVTITGGTVTLSCKAVANGGETSYSIFAYEPIVISDELTITGAKTSFKEGDTQIIPESFDTPVVIAKQFDYLLGDVNSDGDVNIKDATAIQKHIAEIALLDSEALKVADFNQDADVSIRDATAIQKFLAGLPY